MWDSELPLTVRHLINDLDSTPTYNDNRLVELVLVSSELMISEVSFPTSYIVDVDAQTLTPDPTNRTAGTRDDNFIALVCLKSATILAQGEAKLSAGQAITIQDGKSLVDLRDIAKYKFQIAQDLQKRYDTAKLQYSMGNTNIGAAILSPYRLNSQSPIGYYDFPGSHWH